MHRLRIECARHQRLGRPRAPEQIDEFSARVLLRLAAMEKPANGAIHAKGMRRTPVGEGRTGAEPLNAVRPVERLALIQPT